MIWFTYYPFALSFFLAFLLISFIFKKKGTTLSKNTGVLLEFICLGVGCLVRGYTKKGIERAFVAFVFALVYFNLDENAVTKGTYLAIFSLFVLYSGYRTTKFDPNNPKNRKSSSYQSSSSDDDFDVRSFMEHHHHSDDDHRSPL